MTRRRSRVCRNVGAVTPRRRRRVEVLRMRHPDARRRVSGPVFPDDMVMPSVISANVNVIAVRGSGYQRAGRIPDAIGPTAMMIRVDVGRPPDRMSGRRSRDDRASRDREGQDEAEKERQLGHVCLRVYRTRLFEKIKPSRFEWTAFLAMLSFSVAQPRWHARSFSRTRRDRCVIRRP